jgi:hypothetical protein
MPNFDHFHYICRRLRKGGSNLPEVDPSPNSGGENYVRYFIVLNVTESQERGIILQTTF